jgi:hypothetical protein
MDIFRDRLRDRCYSEIPRVHGTNRALWANQRRRLEIHLVPGATVT